MMEDYSKYTKEELINLMNETISEYNEYKDVVSQAYDGMSNASKRYIQIMDELEKYNGKE